MTTTIMSSTNGDSAQQQQQQQANPNPAKNGTSSSLDSIDENQITVLPARNCGPAEAGATCNNNKDHAPYISTDKKKKKHSNKMKWSFGLLPTSGLTGPQPSPEVQQQSDLEMGAPADAQQEQNEGTNTNIIDLPLKIIEEMEEKNHSSSSARASKHSGEQEAAGKPHDNDDSGSFSANSTNSLRQGFASRTGLIAVLILAVGAGAAAIILGAGIRAAQQEQYNQFDRAAARLAQQFETTMYDYLNAGLWTYQAAFGQRDTMTPRDFRVAYEYLLSTGLQVQAASFITKVEGPVERERIENRTRTYLQEDYPDIHYHGITGFNAPDQPPGPRDNASVYYPVVAIEPLDDPKNQFTLSFDVYTSSERRAAIDEAIRTYKPALTERLKLIQEGVEGTDEHAYSIVLYHPGIPLSNRTPTETHQQSLRPRDFTATVLRIPDTLTKTRRDFPLVRHQNSVYIFDSTNVESDEDFVDANKPKPPFLGGCLFHTDAHVKKSGEWIKFYDEIDLIDLTASPHRYMQKRRIQIASREWTFVVVAGYEEYQASIWLVVLGGSFVFVACLGLAAWVVTNQRKWAAMNKIKAQADAEKAQILLTNARDAATKERELNDFLSHEVRNPVSAAISACSFVHSAIQDNTQEETGDLMATSEDRKVILEDVTIIESSLQFVNDLLRNMLDMHRAACKQMKIQMAPVDLLHDVLEPVASMLYQRGSDFQVLLDCPEGLVIITDKLRLKQTCLNLGRNSTKFITKGFIRLRAAIVNGNVEVYVEDSGSGIPKEKRANIFGKFQEALDTMSQGTGMGLSLCLKLVELMGGNLSLDEEYHSGVQGSPGARFVIELNTQPIDMKSMASHSLVGRSISQRQRSTSMTEQTDNTTNSCALLPKNLSVLFVGDDWKVRTLFSQALGRVAKGWTLREAASGETALRLVEEQDFSIIFMEQYTSSVAKQLLGTETVQALRARGVTSAICGMSDDNVEKAFLQAGANLFCQKPVPTDTEELAQVLCRLLDSANNYDFSRRMTMGRNPMPIHSTPDTSGGRNIRARASQSLTSSGVTRLMNRLPRTLSVLIVDDDAHLGQLWSRSLKRVAPMWSITEASSGVEALEITNDKVFDLVFLDQYMPNPRKTENTLLGSETAAALRAKGITSIICGLSANDVEKAFLQAGANCFHIKPFPCKKEELTRELLKILSLSDLTMKENNNSQVANQSQPYRAPPMESGGKHPGSNSDNGLPEDLRVLYADDSPSLRKMFSRSIQRITKGWTIHEVECGEEALKAALDANETFDLIFLDQHMSTDMLGTDTAKNLREKNVTSVICGLSGDDIECRFLEAGANSFMMKPFPCEKDQLAAELRRILQS